jgi:protein PhnA
MPELPACPQCAGVHTYPDGAMLACPDCGHEWSAQAGAAADAGARAVVRDCNGNPLADGDTVVVIKDLKVKGSSTGLKQGTLIRDIRLVEDDVDHVEGNVEKIKGLVVKTCFVRKA